MILFDKNTKQIPNVNEVQHNIDGFEDYQKQNNTKIYDPKILNTNNTNTNKTIGIFAKKGPIYCSQ